MRRRPRLHSTLAASRGRPRPAAAAWAMAIVAALLVPAGVLAATVEELAKLAETYGMQCATGASAQVCIHPDFRWRAVIQPEKGPEETLLTELADPEPPLEQNAEAWMADMHQVACGDPKGVSAFVAAVAQMSVFDKVREIKATIGVCDFVGGLYDGQLAPLTYRVTSTALPAPSSPPTAPPTPGPTSGSSGQPTAQPTSTPGPSASPGQSIAPVASGSAQPNGSVEPAGSPAGSAGPSPTAVVAGEATEGPSPAPTDAVAGPGQSPSPAPGPPTFEESVLGLEEVNTDPRALGGSLVLALLMLLIIGFAGELFNNTIENNYDEISGWFRKGLLGRLRRLGGRLGGRAGVGLLGFVVLTALVNSFADPSFGLDLRSVAVFLGFLVGLIVVLASFKLPQMLAHRRDTGELGRLRPLPWALGIAVLFVLVSRIGDLQPGYLYGLVLGVLFVKESPERDEGRHTFFASVWTLAAAVLAWLGLGWLRSLGYPEDGFGVTLLSTAFAATLVGGLEAAAFGLMPLRFMPGHAVYQWNRLGWALLFGLSVFAFVHLLIGPDSGYVSELSPAAFVAACGVFAAFGALSLAIWGYFRFRSRPA